MAKQRATPGQLATNTRAAAESFRIWGLTGGIASGKSTAARLFEQAGVRVVDADRISRELSAPGGVARGAILERFGTADRAELRALIFDDPVARKDLESILHPLIVFESMNRLRNASGPDMKPVLYEAALLVENGRYKNLHGLIVVEASPEIRLKRLIERDHLSPELAQKMMNAQIADELRRPAATFLLQNDGDLERLREQVLNVIPQL